MKRKVATSLIIVALLFLLVPTVSAQKPTVSALSAVLYEPASGRFLFEKDADTKRPMASTTKLMTALVAAEILPLQQDVTIPEKAVLVEGTSMGLRGGDSITVNDLLTGLLLSSGNDAANALALLCSGSYPSFAGRMNEKAKQLGMVSSVFVTPSGLDEGEHCSTARDMARLGAAVLQVPALADICALKQAKVSFGNPKQSVLLTNHNRLLSLYTEAIGLKTGFTKKAGRCLVSAARRNGVTLIAVTLHAGDDWNDHIALYEYGFSQTCSVTPALPVLPQMPVAGGESVSVSLKAVAPQAMVLLNEEQNEIRVSIHAPPFLWAPIEAGDIVGSVCYCVGDRVVQTVPIFAEESVAKRAPKPFVTKWLQIFIKLLKVV